jgi:hypothetical protein
MARSAYILDLTQLEARAKGAGVCWRPRNAGRLRADRLDRFSWRTEDEGFGPTQRRRYSPACRLFVGFDAFP